MRERGELEVHEHRRVCGETEFGKILALHEEADGFFDVCRELIKGIALSDDGDGDAFGDIAAVALGDRELQDAFHVSSIPYPEKPPRITAVSITCAIITNGSRDDATARGCPASGCWYLKTLSP